MSPTFVDDEIASQPRTWSEAVRLASTVAAALPSAGERVAFVGCGTSWFVAMAVAVRREELGLGESDAFAASEFPRGRRYDRVVAISTVSGGSMLGTDSDTMGLPLRSLWPR